MWYLSSISLSIPHHVPHNIVAINLCVFFFFDKVLSSVSADHMCMGMSHQSMGNLPMATPCDKKKFSFPKLLSIASVKMVLRDYLLHLCFDLGLAWSCTGLEKVTTAALNSWFPQPCHAQKSGFHSLPPHSFCLPFFFSMFAEPWWWWD